LQLVPKPFNEFGTDILISVKMGANVELAARVLYSREMCLKCDKQLQNLCPNFVVCLW